jgi:hypothetical protein
MDGWIDCRLGSDDEDAGLGNIHKDKVHRQISGRAPDYRSSALPVDPGRDPAYYLKKKLSRSTGDLPKDMFAESKVK